MKRGRFQIKDYLKLFVIDLRDLTWAAFGRPSGSRERELFV